MLLKLNANETLNKKSPLIEGAIVKLVDISLSI